MLKVLTVTNQPERAQPLLKSLDRNGWEYECLVTEWRGFGTKLIAVYEYLKQHPEVEQFIFCDAHDVVCLGTPEEFIMKKQLYFDGVDAIFSSEKGCWPDGALSDKYPPCDSPFKYLNSGCYCVKSKKFIEIFESNPIGYADDDQLYFTKYYLNGFIPNSFCQTNGMYLDTCQHLFNSHSFIAPDEYGYENNRIQILGNQSVFCHFNGGTVDEKFNELIKI